VSRLRIPRRRPSAAMVVACCALFVALGGTSYALAVGSIGTREIRDDSIRSIDIHNRSLKGNDLRADSVGGGAIKEQTLDASKLGTVARAAAADHAASADTADSVRSSDSATTAAALQLQVAVTADGGRSNARGVTDVDKIGTGVYIVTFDRKVQDCVGIATPIFEFDISAPPNAAGTAQIALQLPTGFPTPDQARQVWVHTGASDGTQADRGFYLLVSC
jgi:hypothetical protein